MALLEPEPDVGTEHAERICVSQAEENLGAPCGLELGENGLISLSLSVVFLE